MQEVYSYLFGMALSQDGRWHHLPHGATSYRQKVFWWREGDNGENDLTLALTVTGQRLDQPAAPLLASKATNAYHASFDWAMLVGVEIPAAGCWEITGEMDGQVLSFVVWVERQHYSGFRKERISTGAFVVTGQDSIPFRRKLRDNPKTPSTRQPGTPWVPLLPESVVVFFVVLERQHLIPIKLFAQLG